MGTVIKLHGADDIATVADRVAKICRGCLLENATVAVSFDRIAYHLGSDRPTVERAVAWLERSRRVDVRAFSLRTRPHVRIPAVCRIDDVEGQRPRAGTG